MKCLDKFVTKVKSLFKKKEKKVKPTKATPETLAFIEENIDVVKYIVENKEAFENIVQYLDVYKAVVSSISGKEIAILNQNAPCKFREQSDVPFRVVCACKVDGEGSKTIQQCEECKYRTE